jgi:hypothetical protein
MPNLYEVGFHKECIDEYTKREKYITKTQQYIRPTTL